MALAVVTVASGGLAVVETASFGLPVTEAANLRGIAVTKVVGKPGLPVMFVSDAGGPVTPPLVPATLDPATVTAVTLSGGNLVATNTGTTSNDQGARIATASGKTAGKYYFEVTTSTSTAGGARSTGVGTTASTFTTMGQTGTTGSACFLTGTVYANSLNPVNTDSVVVAGSVRGVAVDLDNRKIWFRKSPSGTWNGNAGFDPAANTGGVTISAGTMVPFITFGGGGGASGNVMTANFGASAFAGAVPSGFTAGWPA